MVVSTSEQQFSFREGWCKNGSVHLHYVESGWDSPSSFTPVVYPHIGFGTAEVFIPEMKALSPRRCVACSLRGRGNSDAPEAGYSFDENVSDIDAVVNHLTFDRICVMGFPSGSNLLNSLRGSPSRTCRRTGPPRLPRPVPQILGRMGGEMVIRAISKGQPRPDERNARTGTRVHRDTPLGQTGRDKISNSPNRRRCRGSPAQTRTRRNVQTTLPKLGSHHLS